MKPRAAANQPPVRTILVAVLGASPAVLTETLWALARETPPVVPDIVVVVTTATGRDTLQRQLLAPVPGWKRRTVWQSLRAALLGARHARDPRLSLASTVVIAAPDTATGATRELDDIRTADDNTAAAETILATVRRFTTDPDCRVLGLLAGGRKTMGALLHAALSLAGRPGDRLLHVLVNEPFDHPGLTPVFWFPGQPGAPVHTTPGGSRHPASEAHIQLADVPIVALGELVTAQAGHTPATFASLTRAADAALADARANTRPVELHYDAGKRTLRLNTFTSVIPQGRPATLCSELWKRALADADLLDRVSLADVLKDQGVTYLGQGEAVPRSEFSAEDISNALNVIRTELMRVGVAEGLLNRLVPRKQPIGFNREGITLSAG